MGGVDADDVRTYLIYLLAMKAFDGNSNPQRTRAQVQVLVGQQCESGYWSRPCGMPIRIPAGQLWSLPMTLASMTLRCRQERAAEDSRMRPTPPTDVVRSAQGSTAGLQSSILPPNDVDRGRTLSSCPHVRRCK